MNRRINSLLIVGASCRAMAEAAHRAGIRAATIDLFADRDTEQWTDFNFRIETLPDAPRQLDRIDLDSIDGWLFAGGMENHPEIIDIISTKLPLLGSSPSSCNQAMRWPLETKPTPQECFRIPESHPPHHPKLDLEENESDNLLRKPLKSAGGFQIATASDWKASEQLRLESRSEYYCQRLIEGQSYSAAFVARPDQATQQVQFLGITKQLVGIPQVGARTFAYCGSIGPFVDGKESQTNLMSGSGYGVSLPDGWATADLFIAIEKMGSQVANQCSISGLFGIDFILNREGIWALDINPRYTSSMELFLRAQLNNPIRLHMESFDFHAPTDGVVHMQDAANETPRKVFGKLILFNRLNRQLKINESISSCLLNNESIRDVPQPDTAIPPGHPIVSVFEMGDTTPDCEKNLLRLAEEVYALVH